MSPAYIEKQKVRDKHYETAHNLLKEEELRFYSSDATSLIEKELNEKIDEVLQSVT